MKFKKAPVPDEPTTESAEINENLESQGNVHQGVVMSFKEADADNVYGKYFGRLQEEAQKMLEPHKESYPIIVKHIISKLWDNDALAYIIVHGGAEEIVKSHVRKPKKPEVWINDIIKLLTVNNVERIHYCGQYYTWILNSNKDTLQLYSNHGHSMPHSFSIDYLQRQNQTEDGCGLALMNGQILRFTVDMALKIERIKKEE